MRRRRIAYAGWVAVVIAAGLASRSAGASFLPDFATAYAGDTLWALMVFLALGFLFPGARTAVLAGSALGISFAVEFSQLCEMDWLKQIRATRVGALMLGQGWVATDLLCYAVGVGIGVAGEVGWRKCRVISDRWERGGDSLAVLGIDDDGDGAVVDEGNLHVGTEAAAADGLGELLFERMAKGLVERLGSLRAGGAEERGAVALFRRGVEGELADHDGVAAGVGEGEVHQAGLVGEDPHAGDFWGQPGEVIRAIAVLDSKQYQQAGPDGGDRLSGDGDGGGGDALDDGAHGVGETVRR